MAWRAWQNSSNRGLLVIKWTASAVCILVLVFFLGPMAWGFGAVIAIPATAAVGLVLAIIWGRDIALLFAKPFASLFDGGDAEPERRPLYSIAHAKRKRGDYLGAREAVREQLKVFPADQEGQMLLAEIEVQDLNDLQAAAIVVDRFVAQRDHSPASVVYALNTMADWCLKYAQDRDAAEAYFRRIIELLPDTEWALLAEQRIAHLVGYEEALSGKQRSQTIQVPHIEGDPGLDGGHSIAKPAEEDLGMQAARYVKHLEQFPHDAEIREQLAHLYGGHYKRLDLAMDQLEQLVQFPHQPMRQVVKWLNLQADFQLKYGGTYEAARAALERIIKLYPQAGISNQARNRIELLALEFKGRNKSQVVKLGSYEDDLGLKGRLPHQL